MSNSGRSINLIKQIIYSAFIKGGMFLLTIIQVPLLKKILNDDQFGVWTTYLSIFNWFLMLDFGIGFGLKNILTRENSFKNYEEVRKYSSAGYLITFLSSLILVIVFFIFHSFVDYKQLLKTHEINAVLGVSSLLMFFVCIILYYNNTINTLMASIQKNSLTYIVNFVVNFLLILSILAFQYFKIDISPLIYLASSNLVFIFLIVLVVMFVFLYKHPQFLLDYSGFSQKYLKEVLKTGGQFFIIQSTILVIFPADGFLVSNLCSSIDAGRYGIIVKIFSVFIVLISVVSQSSWPAFTDAYFSNNKEWMYSTFKKINLMTLAVSVFVVVFSYFTNMISGYWAHVNDFTTLEITSTVFLHIMLLYNFNSTTILYAIGALKSQMLIGFVLAMIKLLILFVFKGQIDSIYKIQFLTGLLFLVFNVYNYITIYNKLSKIRN